MSRALNAVTRWREFASKPLVPTSQGTVSWDEYTHRTDARSDEERVVQPVAFPRFAATLLGWDLETNLSAEASDQEGQPDFTPADAVTHPFVFETKGTNAGFEIAGYDTQVKKYLTVGAPRIKKVVLTNLVGAAVYDLDDNGNLRLKYRVNMRGLLRGDIVSVASTPEADRLADLLEEFQRQELTREQKLDRVKAAPDWNPAVNHTTSSWIVTRVDSVVNLLTARVLERLLTGVLDDSSVVLEEEYAAVLPELRTLANRIGVENVDGLSVANFVDAPETSALHTALRQFAAHAAFFTTAKLLLVRVWEDLGIVEPMLYDGGFRTQMARFQDAIRDVVKYAFENAKSHYRLLFDQRNAYSWFVPSDDDFADIVYELANTYFGEIESDVLGQVYERMLERIDRKLLGVYYTPRDIIQLIWDLVDLEAVSEEAEAEGRTPRVLDIATGSGGFLVEAAARLRGRLARQQEAGEQIQQGKWLSDVADGLNGVEYQRFAAYLAELNLIVQLSHVIAAHGAAAIPSMGILAADTLSLHEPVPVFAGLDIPEFEPLVAQPTAADRREKIRAAEANNFLMDVAIGNPPYIGEKLAAPIFRATRRDYPYWENFVGQHMDYLYWFLILGVSKLRDEGRFGFITTEYWIRAEGARPLRKYLSEKAEIERIILFRNFRLFPDAPGQHSMIVIGRRVASPTAAKPRVSIYTGPANVGHNRANVLSALRGGRTASDVRSFNSTLAPLTLRGDSWAQIVLTREEVARRRRVLSAPQVDLLISKGVETTVNGLKPETEQYLTGAALSRLGAGRDAGIQLLSSAEVTALGHLNDEEAKTLRRVVNTRDIFPYAVVVPEDADRVVYLAKPDVLNVVDPVSGIPFPSGLPVLRDRLELFRPLLEFKTRDRGEARPWWTLHRARENIVGDAAPDEHGWAPFGVTTRWGEGGRLILGLAPGYASPASGLHIIRPRGDAVGAAYLAGMYGSDVFQEIAESLPPGALRKDDLERIGMPLPTAAVIEAVSNSAYDLAGIVTQMIREVAPRFPALPDLLKSDVSLPDSPFGTWTPSRTGAGRGALESVPWLQIRRLRAASSKLGETSVTDDLLGHVLKVHLRGDPERVIAEIEIAEHVSDNVVGPLRAMLAGAAYRSRTLGEALRELLPVSADDLIATYAEDCADLDALATRYRNGRAAIEQALGGL